MNANEKKLREELSLTLMGEGRRNYSVKAGAGAGKTTMLSQRICQQILEGTPIDEFVVITYTNAAASELREKISSKLYQMLSVVKGEELENVKNALHSIELMQISTIHAFLLKLLKEHSFESGIVLDVQMLEAEQDQKRKDKFFRQWYKEHYEDIAGFRDDWIYIAKGNGNKSYHEKEVIQNMFNSIANIREEIVYDVADHAEDMEKETKAFIQQWKTELIMFKGAYEDNYPLKKTGERMNSVANGDKLVNYVSVLESSIADDMQKACCVFEILKMISNGVNFYWNKGAGKEQNIILNTYSADIAAKLPKCELEWNFEKRCEYADYSQKASKVVEYAIQIQKAYQKEIDKETLVISNDDILYRSKKLLTEHQEVLDDVRTKYSKIYVDEFQDTTGLQADIIRLIAERKGTALEENDFDSDKLLFVGDPKQSIYRFTGAEISVYRKLDNIIDEKDDAEGKSVTLDSNFRSNKAIVDWVNNCFGKLMPGQYSNMDTDWEVKNANTLHGVFRYEKGEEYKKDDDVEAVIDLVEKLVNSKYCIEKPIRNDKGEITGYLPKSIEYSDIMVICRNTFNMSPYVKKFATKGIPVILQGKFSVDDDEVLLNFIILAEYFAGYKNKKNQKAAAQILQGSDLTAVSSEVLEKAENRLWEIKKEFSDKKMDSAAKLQYLMFEEELFLPKGKKLSKERIREYRTRLHQMVETCLKNNKGDFKSLVEEMRKYLETDVNREISLVSNENAVQFMNVHKAKGLTGHIVIIADRSNDDSPRYGGFKKEGRYYPSVSYKYNDEGKSKVWPSYGHDIALLKQAYEEEMAESIRLQYVAATRAAYALIILPNIEKNVWFSAPEYNYDSLPDINKWLEDNADLVEASSIEEDDKTAGIILTLEDLYRNKRKRFDSENDNYGELENRQVISITPSGIERKGSTGFSSDEKENGYIRENRPQGNIFGLILHRVYELIFTGYSIWKDKSDDEIRKTIDQTINLSIMEHRDELKKEDAVLIHDYLKNIMDNYYKKVIVPIAEEAEEIYPEYSFSFYIPDEEREWFKSEFEPYLTERKIDINDAPIWVNGQADLVVKKKNGGYIVYDYKSDAMNGKPYDQFKNSLDRKYEGQLKLYIYAVSKNFEVKQEEVSTELIHLYR